MQVGLYGFEVHLPNSGSLKQKRQVVKRLKDRLRSRYNISIAESDAHAEVWQRAELTVAALAAHEEMLRRLFDSIRTEAEALIPGHFVEIGTDFLEIDLMGVDEWMNDNET